MSAEQDHQKSTELKPAGLTTSPPSVGTPGLQQAHALRADFRGGGTPRKFLVGDAVRFKTDSRLRLSFNVEPDEIGTVENWIEDGTPLQRIDVQFPRDIVRGAEASQFEIAQTVVPNSTRPKTTILPFAAEDHSSVPTDTAARQRAFVAATSGEVQAIPPVASNATPLPPQVQVVELSARSTAMASGGAMMTAAAIGTPAAAPFDRNLQDRATEVRDSARILASAIREQVAEWKASRPNHPDTLDKYDNLIAFLERIAVELERMADKLDEAIAAGTPGSPEPILLGKAGQLARELGADVVGFLDQNRQHLGGLTVRTVVFGALYVFLHACGLGGEAAGFASGLVAASIPPAERKK